ncbi:p53 and DNA damage regulated protein [Fasciola hepatica]|uniref:P53 and DNA damage regulated protein n=1 Tax=Fasciola hepatica TaxID=6192 RepID=A0A4E0RWU5_FASHE|nr:p53 and DNA damage regulated protein [Fasciola hepatica]
MPLCRHQQKVLDHLVQIEEVGEPVLAKREQCVSRDRSRQKTREAIRALTKLGSKKQWAFLSNQFFLLPRETLVDALRKDIKLYDSEIEKTRKQMKEDIKILNKLEEKESVKGFNITALVKEDVPM